MLRSAIVAACLLSAVPAAWAQSSSRAYVLADALGHPEGPSTTEVVVIDPATGNQIARVGLGPSRSTTVRDLVFRTNGSIGYVSDGADVAVLDPVAIGISARFAAGQNPGRLALSPDGSRLVVANSGAGILSVVDTTSRTVAATVNLSKIPIEMVFAPDGARLYVLAGGNPGSVYVIENSTLSVVADIPTELHPTHIEVHPSGGTLYVTHTNPMFLSPPAGEASLTAIDTISHSQVGRLVFTRLGGPHTGGLPTNYTHRPVFSADGSRLFVPQWAKYWKTSPTAFIDTERLNVIDPATLTIAGEVTPPGLNRVNGRFVVFTGAGSQLMGVSPRGTTTFDSSSNAMLPLGPAIGWGLAAATVPAPPCAFVVWPQQRYVRTTDAVVVDVPAPSGCQWSATFSSDWLTMTTPASGVGPGTISLTPTAGADLKSSTLTIAGQSVRIQRAIGSVAIESIADGARFTQPVVLSGWSADRTATAENGIPTVAVWDGSTGPLPNLSRADRADIASLYGTPYTRSGFSLPLTRLSAGAHTLRAVATSQLDGTVMNASVNVIVERRTAGALDLPAHGSSVTQPFTIRGWALDATAASGVGVDAVQVWAHPANGGSPTLLPISLGVIRGDIHSYMGDSSWAPSGFGGTAIGLAGGEYTIRVLARSTVTGQFDTIAESRVTVASGGARPIGAFDTPSGIGSPYSGSVAVTGWALDDVAVDRVEIWRDLVAGETTPPFNGGGLGQGKVFIATAPFVTGARPDIAAQYPSFPFADRSGWGYLLLTYGLWNQGNGTYTLHAFAYDSDGNGTVLGSKTMVVNNPASTKPFGALDAPGIGQTVSENFWNFGWALTPNATPGCTIPADGVRVSIDSGPLVPVTYGDARSDIAASFPGYSNSSAAGGAYFVDISSLANGTHSIGWYVVDSCNRSEGIGSRFFTVMKTGSGTEIGEPGTGSRELGTPSPQPVARSPRAHRVVVKPGERIKLPFAGTIVGYHVVSGERRSLPLGSSLDSTGGVFYWAPAPGFSGAFDLEFVNASGDIKRVRVIVGSAVQAVIDTPRPGAVASTFTIAGWAIDEGAASGTGINTVHVWAYPSQGGAPVFLGVADSGRSRPDVGDVFGDQFSGAGFSLSVDNKLPPGRYQIVMYPHSAVTGDFRGAKAVLLTIR